MQPFRASLLDIVLMIPNEIANERGMSQLHPGWTGSLVFSRELDAFIELASAPPDVRGNSADDAREVDDEYAKRVYGKTRADVPKPA